MSRAAEGLVLSVVLSGLLPFFTVLPALAAGQAAQGAKGVAIVPSGPPVAAPAPGATEPATVGSDALTAELNVRVDSDQARIWLDGQEVGKGSYQAVVPVGRRRLRVEQPGYEAYDAWVEVVAGQVRTETVSLKQTVVPLAPPAPSPEARNSNGIYGGLAFFGVTQPYGAGTAFEDGCNTLGATECSSNQPMGAGLDLHLGWLKEPLGIELAGMASAHVQKAKARFDGVNGSSVNPVLAAPERDEDFLIGRFGGAVALRGRLAYSSSLFRLWLAAGPGIGYRSMAFKRDTKAVDGGSGTYAQANVNYWSALLSIEAGVELRVTQSFGISLGIMSWFENAGGSAKSEPFNDAVILDANDKPTARQATPSYELARGPQWFVGPLLGFHFGM